MTGPSQLSSQQLSDTTGRRYSLHEGSPPHHPATHGSLHLFMNHLEQALSMLFRPVRASLYHSQQRSCLWDRQSVHATNLIHQRDTLLLHKFVEIRSLAQMAKVTIKRLKPLVGHSTSYRNVVAPFGILKPKLHAAQNINTQTV